MPPPHPTPHPKPIIGIVGGIGSGKSLVASLMADLGSAVIDSDKAAREALEDPSVVATLRQWWGPSVLTPEGKPDRRAIGRKVFSNPADKEKLEGLIHPRVTEKRLRDTATAMANPAVTAVVWDTPLLFEVGLHRECTAVVFVKTPRQQRLDRVMQSRQWPPDELEKREKMQLPLDKKEQMADYVVDNSGDVTTLRRRVRDVFSLILAMTSPGN